MTATPMNQADFELILRDVTCPPHSFVIGHDPAPPGTLRRCWLQVSAMLPDNTVPGANASLQKGRKWFLSNYMTKSEVVQTALKAVLVFQEHETRETFKYRGRAIFDPHYDVDGLWLLRGRGDALSEREPMSQFKTARKTDFAKVEATSEAEVLRQMAADGEVPDCGHGWVIPHKAGLKKDCGGPKQCPLCGIDAKALALYSDRVRDAARAQEPLMGALVGDPLNPPGREQPAPPWGP